MAEYWKSTPSYWCKFCSQYVRDTSIERSNHEASAKHQNNIQRSLRELHKGQEREKREKQAAKDEVTRLNGMFDGKGADSRAAAKVALAPGPRVSQPAAPSMSSSAQRRAHAEQLAGMGIALPEELKKEVTGVGNYHVISSREVKPGSSGAVSVNRSLADILAEAKQNTREVKEEEEEEDDDKSKTEGVFKRKAEDDEDYRDEEAAPKRKAWGSHVKRYPGVEDTSQDTGDLDVLLSGVAKRKQPALKAETTEDGDPVKKEEGEDDMHPINTVPDVLTSNTSAVRLEGSGAVPAVIFKKRKGKK